MTSILILILIVLFISALLFLPMKFGVQYKKTSHDNKLCLYISFLGILIPISLNNKKDEKHAKDKTHKKISKSKLDSSEFTFDSFKKNVDLLSDAVQVSKDELKVMLPYIRKHLHCTEFDFKISFGFDNAAKTGIATGAVWTSGTLLLKIIDSLIGIKKINMNVYPDFNEKKFDIYLKTVLIIQPFRFIILSKRVIDVVKFIKNKINHM